MIPLKNIAWPKLITLFLVLFLLVVIIGNWGHGEDEDTPAAALTEPVKIGLICDYTGTTAIGRVMNEAAHVVEDQVEAMGGILGGRPLKIETADGKGTVADAVAGFRKLALQGASVIVGGGNTAAQTLANVETAEEYKVLYVNWGKAPDDLTDYPYTVRAIILKTDQMVMGAADFVLNDLKAKKVAILLDNTEMYELGDGLKEKLDAEGIEIVLTEYIAPGIMDFSPYLTKIKYSEADVVIAAFANPGAYMSIFKQIMGLGGWGNTKFVSLAPTSMLAISMPGSEGTYHFLTWYPEIPYPENQRFVQDFSNKYGRPPNVAQFYCYQFLWTAIHAIELAGSDNPEDIAKAARSGNLEWDSPVGPYRISADGEHNMTAQMLMVKQGRLVPLPSEQ